MSEGLLAEDLEGPLWPVKLIEASRGAAAPPAVEDLVRVVIGVDPPASAAGTCGIVACGIDAQGVVHVLGDHSAGGLSPEGWAARVAAAVEAHKADRVVAEKNQGGDMVASVLRSAGRALPVTLVSATRGKVTRAEPVAARFECGQARLAGRFPEFKAELAIWALAIAPRGSRESVYLDLWGRIGLRAALHDTWRFSAAT
ncbi:DNA-packaging protein [Sphingomonas sp. Root241]|uniref:DNA-packaging protein n=1 Tax=Sphingomonas sp. Root241 TaxID=1736501 RepID=UPI00138F3ED9|nr:DNA-packaging protein [Sphingomonas sp. Root241]